MLPNNHLRTFKDVDDLFDNIPNETILEWVNDLARVKETQRTMGKKYRLKQAALAKLAEQYLDRDELERVKAEAGEKAEERE